VNAAARMLIGAVTGGTVGFLFACLMTGSWSFGAVRRHAPKPASAYLAQERRERGEDCPNCTAAAQGRICLGGGKSIAPEDFPGYISYVYGPTATRPKESSS
jgi:hypothetical protein